MLWVILSWICFPFLHTFKAASILLLLYKPATLGLGVFGYVALSTPGILCVRSSWYVLCHSDLVCGFLGRLCGKRRWLSDFFTAQAGRHQGQQAGHESAALCCYGKSWNVGLRDEACVIKLMKWNLRQSLFTKCRAAAVYVQPKYWWVPFFHIGNKQFKFGISHSVHN